MQSVAHKTIATELHGRLSAIVTRTGTVDEIALGYIKRDAEKLMHIDPVEALTILGGAAAVRFRDQEMDEHHQAAIRLSPTAQTITQYAISLQIAERWDDAAKQATVAADKDPLDLAIQSRAIRYLGIAGRLEEGVQRIEQFYRRFPGAQLADGSDISLAVDILARHGVPEQEVHLCQKEAFSLLREKSIRNTAICISANHGDIDEMVSYAISLAEPLETIMELDAELGERLFTICPELHLNRFWLGFDRDHEA